MSRTIELANKLSKRATNLENAAAVVLWMTLLGSAIIIVIGLIPVCPPGLVDCYDSEKTQKWALVISGLIAAMSAWWIYALSDVFAGRAQLAAEIAVPVAVKTSATE